METSRGSLGNKVKKTTQKVSRKNDNRKRM